MTTTTLDVTGMTCNNCVNHVTEELKALENVNDVSVLLDAGGTSTITVTSAEPLERAALEEAIDEAGDYTLVAVH